MASELRRRAPTQSDGVLMALAPWGGERPAAKRRTAAANFFDLGREEWRPLVWPPGEKSSTPPLRHRRSRRQPAFATIRQIENASERNEHDGANDGDGKFTLSRKQRHRLAAPRSSTCGRSPTAEDNAGKRSSRRIPRGIGRNAGEKHGDRSRAKNRLMRLSRARLPSLRPEGQGLTGAFFRIGTKTDQSNRIGAGRADVERRLLFRSLGRRLFYCRRLVLPRSFSLGYAARLILAGR